MVAKRRIRSPHPGVVLKQRTLPSGATSWRARFDDPDTGRESYVTLDAVALPTKEARKLWAVRKSRELARRRMDIEAGAPRRVERSLADAVSGFLGECEHRLRGRTVGSYRLGIGSFVVWSRKQGIASPAELTAPRLVAFREHVVAAPRAGVKRGGTRGERQETAAKRSPFTVNGQLRPVKTMLNAWRLSGLMPALTKDAIADALKILPTPREQAQYLLPAQIRKLLEAAARHDAACFDATRDEHAGRRERGTTKRYEPIAPFVAFLLLSGCRRGEALGLRWSDVDVDAPDHDGKHVGEIRLKAAATKTKRGRTIGLEVSPALRKILKTLRRRRKDENDFVFGGAEAFTEDMIESARKRMIGEFGAPKFDWQLLRSTCATYLTNAPSIFGAASAYMSARQLGHSVAVAEKHYLGVHRGIPKDATTLEAAMGWRTRSP